MYNVFGSGSTHGPYAQFMDQSAIHNNGKRIGLLRGCGTRFASYFYSWVRLLRVKDALTATIHQLKFRELDLNEQAKLAVKDIEDKTFWKAIYTILCAVFPALHALRFCDSNTPAMDKIYHLCFRTTNAIELSIDLLNDESLFGHIAEHESVGLDREEEEVYGFIAVDR